MSQPVAEVLAVPGGVDPAPRHLVHRAALHAGADRGQRLLLRREHQLVHLDRLVLQVARGEGAGAVRAVAVHPAAHVDDHKRVGGDALVTGGGVGKRSMRPARDDRGERRVLGPALAHLALHVERHLALGAPHEAAGLDVLVHVVGEVGGLPDRLQLARLLHRAQVLHQAARGDQLDLVAHQLLQALVLADGEVLVLEADAARLDPLDDVAEQVLLAAQPLEVRHLDLRALDVAEVGQEEALVRADEAEPVGAGEAAQVADVHEVRDEQQVELALGEPLHQPIGAGGAQLSKAPFSISRASR